MFNLFITFNITSTSKMEAIATNNIVLAFFKRENYFAPQKSILPVSSNSDSAKCRDFDLDKPNCLWKNSNITKRIQYAKIYPLQAKKNIDYIAITIKADDDNSSIPFCDMV